MASADERYEPGDIVIVPFPYTDLSAAKERPALVVSNASFNRGHDVIVCAISSQLAQTEHSVLIGKEDLRSGKLAKPSRVRVSRIATLERSILRARVAKLRPETLARVRRELGALLSE